MLLEVSVLCLMTWYNVGMEKLLYLGDVVVWRGAWGTESPKEVKVDRIEITSREIEKNGTSVSSVSWDEPYFVVFLDNNKWAYKYQISPLVYSA